MLTIQCPDCGEKYPVAERLAGCSIRCRFCQHEFSVPDAAMPTVEEPPSRSTNWPEERPARSRRKSSQGRTILLTCGIVALVVLLACGGLGTAIYFAFIHEIEEPVTAVDREMVFTAEQLAPFSDALHPDPSRATLRKIRHHDGSHELTYEYEAPDGADESLYVNHEIGVERNPQDAQYSYNGLGIGTNIGLRLGGTGKIRQVERNDLWRWGDESKCVLLMNGENKVGNLFMARKGKRYFSLMIVGVYFEDSQPIQQLLGPMLRRLDSYEP